MIMDSVSAPIAASVTELSPRDARSIQRLKQSGLTLVEVTISRVSPLKGFLVDNITLPPSTRIACLLRGNVPVLSLHNAFIEELDTLYLFTEDEQAVREHFIL